MKPPLPSFNYKQFLKHVRKGPGFGCWSEFRILASWRRQGFNLKTSSRVTAADVARSCIDRDYRQVGFTLRVAIATLDEASLVLLAKHIGIYRRVMRMHKRFGRRSGRHYYEVLISKWPCYRNKKRAIRWIACQG